MNSPYRKITPWALAEVARVSVMYGNEYRSSASEHDLLECCAAHEAVMGWELQYDKQGSLSNFMARVSYQQFQFQGSVHGEFGRTLALYEQTSGLQELQVLNENWQYELLGCSLREYCGVAFLLHVGALQNAGTFDESWLHQPQFEEIVGLVSADTIQAVIHSFSATVYELRALQEDHDRRVRSDRALRRLTFNALQDKPAIRGVSERLLLPSPRLLLNKASCLGVFHVGVRHFSKAFADDTGHLFEEYVGRQLHLIPEVRVVPEIAFGKGKGEKSADWFVIHDEVVLIIEAKARRPVEAVRLGADVAFDSIVSSLGGAVGQISRTAEKVTARHPAFLDIPADRPLVGIVLTMERFHLVNTDAYDGLLDGAAIPTIVLSVSELEHLVTVSSENPCALLAGRIHSIENGQWSFEESMKDVLMGHNVVLDEGWSVLPWRDAAGSVTDHEVPTESAEL